MEIAPKVICEDLLTMLARLKVSLASIAEQYDLTPPQLWALYAIFKGQATMGQVAGKLHCDASNITGIIDRLVARDLVTRQESPADRRAKVLALTLAGQQVIDDITSKLPDELGCTRLSAAERATLHQLIDKLR